MAWAGKLALNDHREPWNGGSRRTLLASPHEGPLRVLASPYPESPAVCHNVIVHPPGGIDGGDTLHVDATLAAGPHALDTTPGAAHAGASAAHAEVVVLRALAPRVLWT